MKAAQAKVSVETAKEVTNDKTLRWGFFSLFSLRNF